VTEEMIREPLTDYSRYKALCEDILAEEREPGFVAVTLRPATVCGYAPRLRLDLTVNILTNHAVNNGRITVFGGSQKRPNLHIDDMVALYLFLLQCPGEDIDGQIFNAGYENHSVMEIARMVQGVVGDHIEIEVTPTDDLRSYHVCSEKLRRQLGFRPLSSIPDAVTGLVDAFTAGKVPGSLDDARYFNIKRMQELDLH
jgi:nucleoside-diphosphate-sugar epimerase